MTTNDPMELIIADALKRAGIAFVHESDNKGQNLDFMLPAFDTYIECKQFPTDRTSAQIAPFANVIVIQGRAAAHLFASMITRDLDQHQKAYDEGYATGFDAGTDAAAEAAEIANS